MSTHPPPEAVVVSKESVQSKSPCDIISSNASFVDALLAEYLEAEEISPDALRSYYVNFYHAQVDNGGFSQFVYNSGWNEGIVARVREGLGAMGATRHLALFEESATLVDDLGPELLRALLESDYFGENIERDLLKAPNDRFFKIAEQENLAVLNAAWLRSLPHLVVMTAHEMEEEVRRRAAAIPDRQQRVAAARANEPRCMKLIRALCEHTGHEFLQITGGNPAYKHAGRQTIAWHFMTDRGRYYMVDADGKSMMFESDSRECLAELDAPEE